MKIKSIKYSQYDGTQKAWKLEEFTLGDINLLVGRNATGKTRTLNVINGLANLLSGQRKLIYISGNYSVRFNKNGQEIVFTLHYEDKKVVKEVLEIKKENLLKRGRNGIGKIKYAKKDENIEFQTPQDELASVARRDNIQHPFLEDLSVWGKSVRYYQFGTPLGRDSFATLEVDDNGITPQINPKDPNQVIAIFREGQKKFGNRFVKTIIQDMQSIGYDLERITIGRASSVTVSGPKLDLVELYAKERDLTSETEQIEISQGMFRALSLIIQVRFSILSGNPSCILIDDIGEGLDFERSAALVGLLVSHAKHSSIQLIMSTNDRFIMNKVPLEYWSVIQRKGNVCKVYNIRNSPKLFEDFLYTGLSNFDFFSSGYYLKGKV